MGVLDALREFNGSPRSGTYTDPKTGKTMPMSTLRHAYLATKSFRDFVRIQATVLFQKDYDAAWALRGGRPSPAERQKLVDEYAAAAGIGCTPRQFLANLEESDEFEAALLIDALSDATTVVPAVVDTPQGRRAPLCAPLELGWPSLAGEMRFRRQQCALSRYLEILAARIIRQEQQQGNKAPSDYIARLAYAAYCGANPSMSSPSFNATMTQPEKERKMRAAMKPFLQRHVPVPKWSVPDNGDVDDSVISACDWVNARSSKL
jgi:hypothetical protein